MGDIINSIGQFLDKIFEIILNIGDSLLAFINILVKAFNGLLALIQTTPSWLNVYFYLFASVFIIYLIVHREGGNK